MADIKSIEEIKKITGPYLAPDITVPDNRFLAELRVSPRNKAEIFEAFMKDISAARKPFIKELEKIPERKELPKLEKQLAKVDEKILNYEKTKDPYQNLDKLAKLSDERANLLEKIGVVKGIIAKKEDEINKGWQQALTSVVNVYTKATPEMLRNLPGYKYELSLHTTLKETVNGVWENFKTFLVRCDAQLEIEEKLAQELSKNIKDIIENKPAFGGLKLSKVEPKFR